MADQELRLLGISGSLRRGSYNRGLLQAAAELAPGGVRVELAGAIDFPLFSQEREQAGWPPEVAELRRAVQAADGIIVATPEYNYSIPGGLKNAFDWLSRPEGKNPTRNKPVAIIGASTSLTGTARAQAHLRQVAYYNAMHIFSGGEILVPRAQERFDGEGRLTDASTRERVAGFLRAFAEFAARFREAA